MTLSTNEVNFREEMLTRTAGIPAMQKDVHDMKENFYPRLSNLEKDVAVQKVLYQEHSKSMDKTMSRAWALAFACFTTFLGVTVTYLTM